jgi:hypothetical protein
VFLQMTNAGRRGERESVKREKKEIPDIEICK